MKKSIICRLSPFNNSTDMPAMQYVIKKLIAFMLVYFLSGVIGEAVIIGILYGMGYDPLNGVMPTGQFAELLFYYGFIIYSLVTFAYCRFIEKRNIKSLGFTKNAAGYFAGALLAVIALFIITGICCFSGSIEFLGFSKNIEIKSLVLWALAFMIQGAAEEIMCRGFLLGSLMKKTSVPAAVVVSSTVFALPHLPSLIESEPLYAIVGIINLYLVSAVLSLLVLRRGDLWIACGLHSAWNFVLYGVMGLSLSGSESTSEGVILFGVKEESILNGAQYGIEASVITTAVLGILLFVIVKIRKGSVCENGV